MEHEKTSDRVNWLKNEMIERTWIMLGEIPKIKVRENLSEDEAFTVEVALIAAIGRQDLGRGPLLNLTDGGEGATGTRWGPAAIERVTPRLRAFNDARSPEQRRINAQKAGAAAADAWYALPADEKAKRNEIRRVTAIATRAAQSTERRREIGVAAYKVSLGLQTTEERSAAGRKGMASRNLTSEQQREFGKLGGRAKNDNMTADEKHQLGVRLNQAMQLAVPAEQRATQLRSAQEAAWATTTGVPRSKEVRDKISATKRRNKRLKMNMDMNDLFS